MKGHNAGHQALRVEIAACTRIMNMEGLIDYSGHVSVRIPDGSGIVICQESAQTANSTEAK